MDLLDLQRSLLLKQRQHLGVIASTPTLDSIAPGMQLRAMLLQIAQQPIEALARW
ncbi:hypothetical protein ACWA5G_08040 [Xanthomonas axonopodis pv. ricini]